jgi:hypothetical protein
MNDHTLKSLDRALDRVERSLDRQRRQPRFTTAPFVFGVALILGYQLLVRLVPTIWSGLVQQGVGQAGKFGPWAKQVIALSRFCQQNFIVAAGFIAMATFAAIVISRGGMLMRFLVSLIAVATILLDVGIIYVVVGAGIESAMNGAGMH